jgi:hypothetical protein
MYMHTLSADKGFSVTGVRPVESTPPTKEPWEQITADFIVELPESQGYNVILVAADRHTKCAHFVSSVLAVSTESTAHLFWDYVWKHHGWAQKIITDQGTQFMAKFTHAL